MIEPNEKLQQTANHRCRRCSRSVDHVDYKSTATGGVYFASCHGQTTHLEVSTTDLEDRDKLLYFDELPKVADVKLSERAAMVFAVLAGLDELTDLGLIGVAKGALLPRLTRRGRDFRDRRQAERQDNEP